MSSTVSTMRRRLLRAGVALLLVPGPAAGCGNGDRGTTDGPGTTASGTPGASSGAPGAPGTTTGAADPSRPVGTPAAGDHRLTLDWQGRERRYEVHAPPGYRPGRKLPLVVVLHYRDGTTTIMREMTRFDAKADREGFLVAYPVGVNGAFNALGCCGDRDDVGFVRTVVEHLIAHWGADADRVYATGLSIGAELTYRLAVEVPGMFAAIAPVSGAFTGSRADADPAYRPLRPVSVIAFAGNNDRSSSAIEMGLRHWRRKLACAEGEPVWADRSKTAARAAARCADGSDVVDYAINDMGHSWPGGAGVGLGDPGTKINAVELIWAFFTAHPAVR